MSAHERHRVLVAPARVGVVRDPWSPWLQSPARRFWALIEWTNGTEAVSFATHVEALEWAREQVRDAHWSHTPECERASMLAVERENRRWIKRLRG